MELTKKFSNSITYCNDVIAEFEKNIFCDMNKALLTGKIVTKLTLACTGYYTTIIRNYDKTVRVILPKELLKGFENIDVLFHKSVMVAGEIRSGKCGLYSIYASYFKLCDENQENFNCIYLRGTISKPIKFIEVQLKTEKRAIAEISLKVEGAENEILCKATENKCKYTKKKLSKGMSVELLGELRKKQENYFVFITKMRKDMK